MKIKTAKVINDGMDAGRASALFDKIEAFAGYGFNKSHATSYSIVSYWTMWLRVRYPAEYFAACMSIVKEDKLPGLVKDAREYGIEVLPPDINLSSDRYVIMSDTEILAPFNAVLGCSDNIANKIVKLRETWGKPITVEKNVRGGKVKTVVIGHEPAKGRFDTFEEFQMAASATGSGVNSRVVDRLDQVGAFAYITENALTPRDPARRKAQTELMPGLIIDVIKADRYTDMTDGFGKSKIIHIVQEYAKCQDCSLSDSVHPTVRIPRSKVRFMVISDSPTWEEEKAGKLLVGDSADYLKAAIAEAGLSVGDGYYTTLVKARKPKDEKFLTNEQINGCRKHLEKEIDVVRPAVIVALGSATIRHFLPDTKGGAGELAGKAIYDPKLGASIVCGLNPAQINFDPSKLDVLKAVFDKVAEIVL